MQHQGGPGEVVIGRRLYRSGQSEYLINGRTARLRDIQELFMGIGLGPDSYAIIEQGRIGQVLSSKPSDRRAIIEEAAGITKYKTKKRLAEAKLESSKLNLSRVNDIYVEVEKQLASLKRQASKARRYAELREQMRGSARRAGQQSRELRCEAERLSLRLAGADGAGERRSAIHRRTGSGAGAAGPPRLRARDRAAAESKPRSVRRPWNWIARKTASCSISGAGEELGERARQLGCGAPSKRTRNWNRFGARVTAQDAVVGAAAGGNHKPRKHPRRSSRAAQPSYRHRCEPFREARIAELRRQIRVRCRRSLQIQRTQAQAEQSLAHHSGALEQLENSEHKCWRNPYHRERSRAAEIAGNP